MGGRAERGERGWRREEGEGIGFGEAAGKGDLWRRRSGAWVVTSTTSERSRSPREGGRRQGRSKGYGGPKRRWAERERWAREERWDARRIRPEVAYLALFKDFGVSPKFSGKGKERKRGNKR